jgi:hypothetical protein
LFNLGASSGVRIMLQQPQIDTYCVRFDATLGVKPKYKDHAGGSIAVVAACERPRRSAETSIMLALVSDLGRQREFNQAGTDRPLAGARQVLGPIVGRLSETIAARFEMPPRLLVWLHRDVGGRFQMLYPGRWSVDVQPLRSISGVAGGSPEAFMEVFPTLAPPVLNQLALFTSDSVPTDR